MRLLKTILCMLLISTQVTQTFNFSGYLADFYNRYRSQSAIVQLILPTALFSTVGVTLYYKYVYMPQMAEQAAKKAKQRQELDAELKQIKEQTEKNILKIKNERTKKALKEKQAEEERILEQQKKVAQQQAYQKEHETFFAPLKKYQLEQLKTVLSTISDASLTTLYQNVGRSGALIIPQEVLNNYKSNLSKILIDYNITPRDEYTENQWNNNAIQEKAQSLKSSIKLYRPIDLQEIPQLVNDAKTISKAFLPPHEISSLDQEQHFFIKKHFSLRRLLTYIKLKKVIEDKKLLHIHLPLKFLAIKNEQTNEYITNKEVIAPLIDKYITIELDYTSPEYGTFLCNGPLFLDRDNTYDLAILAEKIIHSGKGFNDNARNELQQLVQEAPFDIGFGNIFTDEKGDAIIIDTEFKGEPAKSSIAKLNRYR